jgi:1-phosphofructokinase
MRSARNATYVHDRRDGERRVVAQEAEPRPIRHELDSLYTTALASGLRCDAALLTGTIHASTLDEGFYRRLTHDLTAGGIPVVTDLAGEQLRGALAGGVTLVKIAERDMREDGYATGSDVVELVGGMVGIHESGARDVVVSRGERPVLALIEGQVIEARGPQFAVADPRGTGDSQSGAITVALARGQSVFDALRLGMAAGAINVTRRGLGSGERDAIEEHAQRIEIRPVGARSAESG